MLRYAASIDRPARRVLEGRDAIGSLLLGNRAAARERGDQPRHVMTNLIVEEQPDGSARVRSYLSFSVTGASGTALLLTATYDDEVVRDGGTWRFRRRRQTGDRRHMSRRLDGGSNNAAGCQAANACTEAPACTRPERDGGA